MSKQAEATGVELSELPKQRAKAKETVVVESSTESLPPQSKSDEPPAFDGADDDVVYVKGHPVIPTGGCSPVCCLNRSPD